MPESPTFVKQKATLSHQIHSHERGESETFPTVQITATISTAIQTLFIIKIKPEFIFRNLLPDPVRLFARFVELFRRDYFQLHDAVSWFSIEIDRWLGGKNVSVRQIGHLPGRVIGSRNKFAVRVVFRSINLIVCFRVLAARPPCLVRLKSSVYTRQRETNGNKNYSPAYLKAI